MSQTEKVLQAKANSRHFLQDSHDYKGVDGRTYQTETQPLAPQTKPDYDKLYILKQGEQMSLQEIYQIERFLTDGTRDTKATPKAKDKDRILSEYPIAMDAKTRRYIGDKEQVFSMLKEKFPEATKNFAKYSAIQYAVKYGAIEQISWSKPAEPKTWTPDMQKAPEKVAVNSKGFDKNNQWVAPSQQKSTEQSITHTKTKADVGPSR